MNIVRLIVALIFLAFGLVVGVLNHDDVRLNLLFAQVQTYSGVAIILALILGVIVGGLIVAATWVWPLYSKLRKANKQASNPPSTTGGY